MVTLYCSVSSKTSRQAISWFENYEVKVVNRRVERITRSDLMHILSLTENGFLDILKKASGSGTRINKIRQSLQLLNFNQAVDLLLENTDVIKVPIVFDEKKLVIGYNSESIRVFISKEYRKKSYPN